MRQRYVPPGNVGMPEDRALHSDTPVVDCRMSMYVLLTRYRKRGTQDAGTTPVD